MGSPVIKMKELEDRLLELNERELGDGKFEVRDALLYFINQPSGKPTSSYYKKDGVDMLASDIADYIGASQRDLKKISGLNKEPLKIVAYGLGVLNKDPGNAKTLLSAFTELEPWLAVYAIAGIWDYKVDEYVASLSGENAQKGYVAKVSADIEGKPMPMVMLELIKRGKARIRSKHDHAHFTTPRSQEVAGKDGYKGLNINLPYDGEIEELYNKLNDDYKLKKGEFAYLNPNPAADEKKQEPNMASRPLPVQETLPFGVN